MCVRFPGDLLGRCGDMNDRASVTRNGRQPIQELSYAKFVLCTATCSGQSGLWIARGDYGRVLSGGRKKAVRTGYGAEWYEHAILPSEAPLAQNLKKLQVVKMGPFRLPHLGCRLLSKLAEPHQLDQLEPTAHPCALLRELQSARLASLTSAAPLCSAGH